MASLFLPNQQNALTSSGDLASQQWYQYFQNLNQIFGVNGALKPTSGGTGIANALTSTITLAGALVIATHGGTIAFPTAGTTQTMPSASKTLMATDFSNASAAGGDLSGSYPNPTVVSTHLSAPLPVAQGGTGNNTGTTPPSGTAGGDLSGTFPNPTVAKINGAGLGTTTATAAHILVADGSNWQSVAVSGAASITTAGVVSITHGAHYQGASSNPAGTNSATAVMLGLAGSITPATSGNVLVTLSGTVTNTNSGGSIEYILRYGTGSAPINGGANTGTNIGVDMVPATAAASQKLNAATSGLVTGLALGTTYWLDVAFDNNGAGTATFSNVALTAVEI